MTAPQSPASTPSAGQVADERVPMRAAVAVHPEGGSSVLAPRPPCSIAVAEADRRLDVALQVRHEVEGRLLEDPDAASLRAEHAAARREVDGARAALAVAVDTVHHDPTRPTYGYIPGQNAILRSVRDRAAEAVQARDESAELIAPGERFEHHVGALTEYLKVAARTAYYRAVRVQYVEAFASEVAAG